MIFKLSPNPDWEFISQLIVNTQYTDHNDDEIMMIIMGNDTK